MPTESRKFGTFGGVFTPNVLTILGVIMFLRFGQVTGQAGMAQAVLILLCAKLITTLTAVSLAGVATNTRVKGGGAYYLISRSLGAEVGGAIAFVFYLAQAISVAMYVIGFAEAWVTVFADGWLGQRGMATLANLAVFVCVFIGAGWTIRVQYVILAILGLALLSFYVGAFEAFSFERLASNRGPGYVAGADFLTMFALFFPAATGIMAGANMSGDLRDPGRSLPAGTFSAIAVTGLVYLSLIVLLGGGALREDLITRNFIMSEMAAVPALIVAGVFAATLSSALGSMMGAPRILQAFARDNVFRGLRVLGRGSGPSAEPRVAIVLTAIVSQAAILLGDLNAVAPIITMFFMVTYGALNLACFYEGYSRNPSFRPRFRYSHWSLGLAGALGCGVAMLLMDPLWAVGALTAMAGLYWGIKRRRIVARWGDVQSGLAFERARRALLRLEAEDFHPKNWRPVVLALSGGAWTRYQIAEYGFWLTSGRGVLSLGQVIAGEVEDRAERSHQAERRLRQFIAEEGLGAFPAVVVDEDLLEGVKALLQCHGIGGIRPNTVLLGWADDPENLGRFAEVLRLSRRLDRNIAVVKCEADREQWSAPAGEIHVWWHNRRNGPLMLIMAHLLSQSADFRGRTIRLIHAVPTDAARPQAEAHLRELIGSARIDAVPCVLVTENLREAMLNTSADAAVLFIGFTPPEPENEIEFYQDIEVLTESLPDVVLVNSAGRVDLEA